MKEEYLNDPIVKSLQAAGFSDEDIEKFIESGDIVIKSKETEDKHEKENIDNDEKHIENLEDDIEEDEEDIEKNKKKKVEKSDCDEEDDDDEEDVEKCDMKKGLSYDMLKAIGEGIAKGLADTLGSRLDSIEKSLEMFGHQAPSFKGADLNSAAYLEKSIQSMKDENNKLTVNIVTQRSVAKALIEKAIENADDALLKSIGEDAKNYLMFPEAETVGENLAMYMYKEQGVKFVK